jgi:NAD(P)-dependent dehydrogenase (short-subunit alcohol dehydrogenase family)
MLGAYTASKFAVAGLSESLHHELTAAGSPVRVSVFCPGPVQTSIRSSERNRPAHVPPASPQPGAAEARPAAADAIPSEMPAAQAAAAVLRGIRDERFWIFTHPETTRREIQARAAWMLNDANPHSTPSPVRSPGTLATATPRHHLTPVPAPREWTLRDLVLQSKWVATRL